MKGYKIFDENLQCRKFQYEIGKTYEHDGKIEICESGFHFCTNPADLFNYYSFNLQNRICEIIASGEILHSEEDSKHVTNRIKIEREMSWGDILQLVNSGGGNSGYRNSGDWNSGNRNSGDWNSGNRNSGYRNSGYGNSGNRNSGDGNSGYRNSGYGNSGNRNSGDWNSGDRNSGDWNSGDWNSGDRNSGDWNSGDRNSGIFNSKEGRIFIFNQLSELKYTDLPKVIFEFRPQVCEFIDSTEMTEEEKTSNPQWETVGGYVKRIKYKDACKKAWEMCTEECKTAIMNLPNFDAEIFFEITGIRI